MTVDREQIRRDAERAVDYEGLNNVHAELGRHCLALLAELEQAQARLAKVPALVESLLEIAEPSLTRGGWQARRAREALAVWDAEQPGPDTTP